MASRYDVRGDGQRTSCSQQQHTGGDEAAREQPPGDAAKKSEEQEAADAGKPRVGPRGVTGPFSLHAHRESGEPRHGERGRDVEVLLHGVSSRMTLSHRFRVRPGAQVNLTQLDPGETHGWVKGAELDAALARNLERIDELQYVMYAE